MQFQKFYYKTLFLISSTHDVKYCSKCFITNLIFKEDYKLSASLTMPCRLSILLSKLDF